MPASDGEEYVVNAIGGAWLVDVLCSAQGGLPIVEFSMYCGLEVNGRSL